MIGCVAPTALAPEIQNVAPAPGITYDGPAATIENKAPVLGASHGGPAPVTEYVAPVTKTAPSPAIEYTSVSDGIDDIDDMARCLNDLRKQGSCPPVILDKWSGRSTTSERSPTNVDRVREGLLLSLRLQCVVFRFSKDAYAMSCSLVARP